MAELSTLGAVIKAAYEGQADTNGFTDAEKAKLAEMTPFSGSYNDLSGKPALDFVPTAQKGQANGVAPLDAAGFVPMQHLNVSGLSFKGAWNPTTNTPTLVDGTGSVGDFYKASASGTFNFGNGSYSFNEGDWAIFAAGVWQRIGSSETVGSVNGKIGDVVLSAADVGALPSSYTAPVITVNGKTGAVSLTAADVGALPSTYQAPVTTVNGKAGAVTLNAADVGALASSYIPTWSSITGKPKLSYADRIGSRVANTWYTNSGGMDRIVSITTNYLTSSVSSRIEMRAAGTTTPVFSARSQATGTGDSNQIMEATVPSGWEYRFVPGTSRTVSTWFEGDYA